MAYYLLFDNHEGQNFLSSQIAKPVEVCYSHGNNLLAWLLGVINVVMKSKCNDTIICWYDFQAVLCFWVDRLLFKKRNIVCINLLLKDKSTLKNKVVSWLYKIALSSREFKASVTSVLYGEWLNRKLGINVKYTLVHDVFHDSYKYVKAVRVEPNTVFCGGKNGRDWHFMLKIAKAMPDITFNIVMPYNIFQEFKHEIKDNMNVKYNILYDDFMKELCSSQLVCLPLDTEAPAGLIVMFQAAANLKPIITTRTATTSEYINDERGVLIQNDLRTWIGAIRNSLADLNKSKNKAENFRNFLCNNCSETTFVNGIKEMLK